MYDCAALNQLDFVGPSGVNDRHLEVSRNCIFHPRVEILFGDFSDQHIERRQPEHGQHQRCGQRDEAKQEVKGDIWQHEGDADNDQRANQQKFSRSAAEEQSARSHDQGDHQLCQ